MSDRVTYNCDVAGPNPSEVKLEYTIYGKQQKAVLL